MSYSIIIGNMRYIAWPDHSHSMTEVTKLYNNLTKKVMVLFVFGMKICFYGENTSVT